jgi:hypothetical protein
LLLSGFHPLDSLGWKMPMEQRVTLDHLDFFMRPLVDDMHEQAGGSGWQ